MPQYGGAQSNEKRGDTSFGLPIGAVIAWGAQLGTTLPNGWLICDGMALLANIYPALFAVMGQIHGNGTHYANGTTTGFATTGFNLPDYRSVSHRGHNAGGTVDPGPRSAQNVGANASGTGSFESHAIQGHWHVVYGTVRGGRYATIPPPSYLYSNAGAPSATFYGAQGRAILNGVNGSYRAGKESRGQNVSATYLIRVF